MVFQRHYARLFHCATEGSCGTSRQPLHEPNHPAGRLSDSAVNVSSCPSHHATFRLYLCSCFSQHEQFSDRSPYMTNFCFAPWTKNVPERMKPRKWLIQISRDSFVMGVFTVADLAVPLWERKGSVCCHWTQSSPTCQSTVHPVTVPFGR